MHGGKTFLVKVEAPSNIEACRYSEHILSHFVPASASQALRQLYEVKSARIDLTDAKEMTKEMTRQGAIERLEAACADVVAAGEQELARILVPPVGNGHRTAQMLLLTQDEVLLIEDRPDGAAIKWSIEVQEVATVELHYSILGSHLRMAAPMGDRVRWLSAASPNPTVFQPMVQLFRALVPLMANPPLVHP